ncbi:ankyrin repeat and EF-hand domain-containing protein 1 [Pelobates fuscus]|uniref:ankyrin repeat and EF-hand domain-containing protein 1 n=1 Tax=Pelobates fuscus TaxID=191477 RepID=UPI002FE4E21F
MVVKMTTAEGRLETLQIYKVLQCVRERDTQQIENLVTFGVPNLIRLTEPRHGLGALHVAVEENDGDMCKFLLSLGVHPDSQDLDGCTPSMKAAELGHDSVLEILADAHADMTIVNKEGKGVLFYCIFPSKRHLHCLRIVLDQGADVNNCTSEGIPILLVACEQARECQEMCLGLLGKGANPNAFHPVTGRTALMEAAREGTVEVVRAILVNGGDVNVLDKLRYNAVHYAAKGGFMEVLKVLSAYNADMGVFDLEGNTALHHAALGGFADCCKFLVQRGCNPTWKNLKSMTAKIVAKKCGFKAAMKEIGKATRLVQKYSKPGVKNSNLPWAIPLHDWSFEHQAVLRKSFEQMETVDGTISKEDFADVLQKTMAPINPEQLNSLIQLHVKGGAGSISIDEFLAGSKFLEKAFLMSSYVPKKKKGKKGKKGKKRKSVLPMPICVMPSNMVSRRADGGPPNFMIEKFQNVTDVNRFDCDHPPENPLTDDTGWYVDELKKTYIPIDSAIKSGDLDSLRKAFEEGVPVDVKDMFYKTPLMYACACGNLKVVEFLLKKGANVNATDNFFWTPLHHACHAGQEDIADLLIKSGSQINAVTFNNSTPLMRAVESGCFNCVQYLIQSGANVKIENKKGENVLDIANAYGDYRLIEVVKAKLDSLPKPKDNTKRRKDKKGGMEGKRKAESKPQTPGIKEEAQIRPAVQPTSEELFANKEKKNEIAQLNNLIATGEAKKIDLAFVPKSVWVPHPNTMERIRSRVLQRERLTYEVDFDDFMMPFNKNLMKKSTGLTDTDVCA